MANQQHLDILQQGTNTWNSWREHEDIRPDLSGANLSDADLSGANLSSTTLSSATLRGATLSHAILRGAKLIDADLRGANLIDANLIDANLIDADLSGADLSGADLSKAYLRDATLRGTTLFKTDLSSTNLSSTDLFKTDLSYANLRGTDLSYANLRGANLSKADLSYATLRGTDLSGATLSHANLSGATLSHANLSDTGLSHANLSYTNLSGANLSGANLSSANLSYARIQSTLFGDRDLRPMKGLATIQHTGPSPLSINSIYLSQGDIPETFVRQTGAPAVFLDYMHALAAKPIAYYSCFISYSSKDQAFAQRLYNDLQGKDIRCWFAPEDLKIGDKFRTRIDESIHIYDKLLLVLSESSVCSPWVETEVETAFEKEHRQKTLTLFPIKLDETVMQTDQPWASNICRTRHIGDFTHWKDHDAYQRGLTRLLRDLKPEGPKSGT